MFDEGGLKKEGFFVAHSRRIESIPYEHEGTGNLISASGRREG